MAGPSESVLGPGARLALRRDEVHLWWGRDGEVESLDASPGWLSDDERRRGERFHRESDARAFRFRRAFLRGLLARYAGCRPEELVFEAGVFGKPALAGPHAGLSFSASSRGGLVLVGLARARALGVDLELEPSPLVAEAEEIARLARRVATERERAVLLARPAQERAGAFLELWTRKEALLKALGTGLAREPGTLQVGWREDEVEPGVLGSGLEPRWLAARPPEGCVASAVVAAAPGEALHLIRLA